MTNPLLSTVFNASAQQWIIPPLSLALALALALVFFAHLRFGGGNSKSNNNKEPPGSTGWPLLGETFAFIAANSSSKGVYEFVRQRHLRFGAVFKTRIFGKTHVFLAGPEAAKLVLRGEFSEFTKSYIKSMQDAVGEHSLLCVNQETHTKLRNVIGNLLSAEALDKSLHHMDNLFISSLLHWAHQPSSIRVIDYTLDITFKIMCGMVMSVEGDEKLNDMRKDFDHISDAMLSLPINIPGTRYYGGMKARERFMKYLEEEIGRRRRGEEYHDDIMQSMLILSDVEVKDNIVTLILAGQTTTAAAMMWALIYLHRTPLVLHKLTQEHLHHHHHHHHLLKMEHVHTMTYTSKVVKEVLRMASIVSWLPRLSLNDCTVHGFHVKKGWILNIDARFMHFDPSVFNDPMEFNPCRFEENPRPYSFLAFGGGVRTCLGINLAKLMITVFLHRLLTTYRWRVEDEDMSLEAWAHFPRLKNGCPITVQLIK